MVDVDPEKRTLSLVLLGGEGIGPEVVEATATVLEQLLPGVRYLRPVHGEEAVARFGTPLPEETQDACRRADAILFGSVLQHSRPVLRFLRWGLETYANLRPAKSRPGLPSPLSKGAPLDLLIVRENLEGEYPSREGTLEDLTSRWPELRDKLGEPLPRGGGNFAVRVITEDRCRHISQVAARLARERRGEGRPGRVTVVTKSNVLRRTDGLFQQVAEEVLEAAGLEHNHFYVDDACRRLVAEPEAFDVILAPNLYGDIMSDIAAELVGGMGMAPSGCVGDRHAYFESVHGSAPDIAGRGIANPLATVLSAELMLGHLGLRDEARALGAAVDRLLADGRVLTPDLGGTARTQEVVEALIALL